MNIAIHTHCETSRNRGRMQFNSIRFNYRDNLRTVRGVAR